MSNGNQRMVVLPGNVKRGNNIHPSQTNGHVELHFFEGAQSANVKLPRPEGKGGRQVAVVVTADGKLHITSPQVASSLRPIMWRHPVALDQLVTYITSDIATGALPLNQRKTDDVLWQIHQAVKALVE